MVMTPWTKAFLLTGAVALLASAAEAQEIQPRMGAPVLGLSASELARFNAGKLEFDHLLTQVEGVGPGFNDTACSGCHLFPSAGGSSEKSVTRFGVAAVGPNPFDPLGALGGSLLQAESINPPLCDESVPVQATVTETRITPPCFGFGLLEAIDDNDILFHQNNPANPWITGEAHMVLPLESAPTDPLRVGRFGWKAQVATVLTFSGDASLNEMGLTNRLVPTENAPNGNAATLAACDFAADPEDGPDINGFDRIDRQTDFQRFLAAPPQTPRSGMTGEAVFNSIGCTDCHVAQFTSGVVAEAALSNKTVRPYSDFLLHDITGPLSSEIGIVQGAGGEHEFRTAPLWGVGARANFTLIHDGRATGNGPDQNLRDAILYHDEEGAPSRNAFAALSATDQQHVIDFLRSLGQLEFDHERDHDVDQVDWFFIHLSAFNGPTPAYTPDDFESISDFDQDGDVDLRDFGVLQRAFTG